MAKAVVDSLEEWGGKDRVVSMSFDTNSSNTGVKFGAYIVIETALGAVSITVPSSSRVLPSYLGISSRKSFHCIRYRTINWSRYTALSTLQTAVELYRQVKLSCSRRRRT